MSELLYIYIGFIQVQKKQNKKNPTAQIKNNQMIRPQLILETLKTKTREMDTKVPDDRQTPFWKSWIETHPVFNFVIFLAVIYPI